MAFNKKLTLDGLTYYNSKIQSQMSQKAPLESPVLTGEPTAPTASDGTNTTQIATTAFVQTTVNNKIAELIDDAPETMDTLKEVADAIAVHQEVTDALNAAIGNKVDKVSGKGLSTNDLTNELMSNYDTAYAHSQSSHAPSNAEANVIETIKVNGTALTPSSKAVDITIPTVSEASQSSSGLMSASDKIKLDGITVKIVPITQEDYDALSESERTNIVFMIN